jgi:predicted TIM-barrel fold metal-dependent hydrolase
MSTITAQETDVKIVDCDVHLVPRSKDELLSRMPAVLRDRLGSRRANNSSGKEGFAAYGPGRRMDSKPRFGPAGSDPDLVFQQLFDEASVDLAILIPEMRYTVDPELNAALAHAFNAWVADTWLGPWNLGNRLYGTISVSMDDPARAVREIEEWAGDPRFKQILISNYSSRPLGFPQYDAVWEAAARHHLPVAMHNTAYAAGAIGSTPTGRFQHWVDFHSMAFPLMYSAHLVSWICSGVFDRFPDFKVVFVEGGFLWHRPIVARLARHWPALQREVQAKRDDPFDYVREHVRFTTQPIEETDKPAEAGRLLELADAAHTLMLSSDYPHHDYDEPKRTLPAGVSAETRRRVWCENATALYNLPRTRSTERWKPIGLDAEGSVGDTKAAAIAGNTADLEGTFG